MSQRRPETAGIAERRKGCDEIAVPLNASDILAYLQNLVDLLVREEHRVDSFFNIHHTNTGLGESQSPRALNSARIEGLSCVQSHVILKAGLRRHSCEELTLARAVTVDSIPIVAQSPRASSYGPLVFCNTVDIRNVTKYLSRSVLQLDFSKTYQAPFSYSRSTMSTKSVPVLTLDGARIALSAAEARAKEIQVPMNIAVLDNACHLLAFARMEGAKFTSIDIAINKAYTAAGHRAPTSVYKEAVWPGGQAFGINNSNGGKFTTIAGGVPIRRDGVVVGAIGCSTGTPSQDEDVAKKGVEAVEKTFGVKAKL
ncbi:hypothetical protein LEMA_P084080.1 [Plenodomus lingam JN3]|uniref:DUF336-domain-containing protein n=1 Tax=Leptosphaeria maculans (strain JN3 / isolate v23.1.3 / race Av1-4-5-6-7-8) TaxID=985895 RepID=E5A6C4_LEPMJ|nr:hypothetical protein LEMA_P084080.1 [Plenodomus lingam JN3]CBX99169.1 hypothetical protein LEMA_P084080.1 [Plenodomus lingam JN3]